MTTTAVPSKDPADFLLNIENLDKFSSSTEATFVNRLGVVKPTLAGSLADVAEKVAEVDSAKNTAITVSIPAAVALVDEAVALTAAGQASVAKVAAEAARDAALIGAGVYVDEPTGRAAVADGVAFKVQGSGDVAAYEYRRTSSTVSVLIASYPSSTAYQSLANLVSSHSVGASSVGVAGGTTVSSYTSYSASPSKISGKLAYLSVAVASAVTAAEIVVSDLNADGTLTMVSTTTVKLVAGVNNLAGLNIPVTVGQYIGVFNATVYLLGSGGLDLWFTTGLTGASSSKSVLTANGLQLQCLVVAPQYEAINYTLPALSALVSPPVAQLSTQVIGPVPTVGAAGGAKLVYIHGSPALTDGVISNFSMAISTAQRFQLVVVSLNGDGTVNLVSSTTFACSVGVNTYTGLSVPIAAGQYAGIFAMGMYSGGNTLDLWYMAALPTTNSAKTVLAGYGTRMSFTILGTDRQALASGSAAAVTVGAARRLGTTAVTATGTPSGTYSLYNQDQAISAGTLTSVSVAVSVAGAATVMVSTLNTDNTMTLTGSMAVSLMAGVNVLSGLNLPVAAGQYVGVNAAGIYQTGVGLGALYNIGVTGAASATTTLQHFGLQLSATVTTGLQKSAAVAASYQGGLVAFHGADRSGATDSTAAFAAARTSSSSVYVPGGEYAVTSLRNFGDGLWGPGNIKLNGKQFFIPSKPEPSSLYLMLRNVFAPQMWDNSPLVLIGDSISQGMGASTAANTFFYMLTSFLNAYTSPNDHPAMVNFDSQMAPSFFGVTVPASPTIGGTGPTGCSITLADGQALTLTGAYADVSAFYDQKSGAGSLVFAYNGTPYRTVVCAGSTVTDVTTYPNPTGQAASGTYTITASGGPVTVTGVVRLGAMTSAEPKRLLTMNHSHASYAFSNYTTTRINSIIKQSQFAGGTNAAAILALGENDHVNVLPADIYTRAVAMIAALRSGGFKTVWGCGILRPAVGAYSPLAGCSYDGANGALRAAYRDTGVPIIPIDAIDFDGLGYGTPHPNDAGQIKYVQMLVEKLAR